MIVSLHGNLMIRVINRELPAALLKISKSPRQFVDNNRKNRLRLRFTPSQQATLTSSKTL
jgi:hypothetical protein